MVDPTQRFLDWARGVPSSGADATSYRAPRLEGARAPSKAEAAAFELSYARQTLSKAR